MPKPIPDEMGRGPNAKHALSAGDHERTLQEYRPLAEQGDAFAQLTLGMMYRKGLGVSRDDTEAAKWLRMAAEQGNADAQINLGIMYRKGQGVPRDEREAEKWYQLAAGEEDLENATTLHKNSGACRAQLFCGTDIVECLMEPFRCQYAVPFAEGKICKHPSAMQFVNSA